MNQFYSKFINVFMINKRSTIFYKLYKINSYLEENEKFALYSAIFNINYFQKKNPEFL